MSKLLIALIVVFGIIAIAQLARVYELTKRLRGRREEDITDSDNRLNANLLMLFLFFIYGIFIWSVAKYGDEMLPEAASEHGQSIDMLMNANLWIIIIAFFITNTLLFFFARKYVYNKNRKAYFFTHSNKLELIWTAIPAVVLAFIIIYGLMTWNEIMDEPETEDYMVVELYSRQFDWTARFPGEDGVLGKANYNLISAKNTLGLITDEAIEEKLGEIDDIVAEIEEALEKRGVPDAQMEEGMDAIHRFEKHKARLLEQKANFQTGDLSANDDIVVKGEMHLPVNKEVLFKFRSQDVIHSAYMPHFRLQMNCVPGMTTSFKMIPIYTTEQMREKTGDSDFDYILLCNKICGASHYNMQMKVVIEEPEKYEAWLSQQKTFVAEEEVKDSTNTAAPSAEVVAGLNN